MGLTSHRLLEYFSVDELKFVLSTINESQSGNREELIERIIVEWPAHNKKWENLLNYLEKPRLSQICNEYSIDHKGNRSTLLKRLKKELSGKSTKIKNSKVHDIGNHSILDKSFSPASDSKKKTIIVIVAAVFSVFLSLSIISHMGTFDWKHETKIDFEKEYYILYSDLLPPTVLEPNETKTFGKGGFGLVTLVGYVKLQSSSFTAQNPIHVEVEMYHTQYGENLDEDFWKSLPNNFFAYFPKAKNIVTIENQFENEKLVVLKLEKMNDPPKIYGKGDLIYPREGEFEFIIFDPFNIPEFDDLRTTLELEYTISTGKLIEESSKYDSNISIKSADSFNSVVSSRNTMTFSLLTLAFTIPSVLFAFRNYWIK